jgi:hypothetical protein
MATTSKIVRRSVPQSTVRRSPIPPASGGVAGGFLGLLARLAGASDRLEKARPRRRR